MTDHQPEVFDHRNLRGARFTACDLTGAVMRGVMADDVEIDSPWLLEGGHLLVNGVDVTAYVDGELDRRFPGRSQRRAGDPEGLRAAWQALGAAWSVTVARAESMPSGTVDVSVAGEWSFAQTLRHLVMATDTWLGRAVLGLEQPYHRHGLANAEAEEDGLDLSVFAPTPPTWEEVMAARAERVGMVERYLAGVTPDVLAEERANPWAPQYPETVLSCLHTILEEEWEHHRYAVRDLDAVEAGGA
ncbi:DinB family protein [Nocardioides aestuarii]|uniref:DinB family protein n=1 Tax=Nocardioides aestuarii TaxID=252231 RepID=A0ABW4TRI9_9ACTN